MISPLNLEQLLELEGKDIASLNPAVLTQLITELIEARKVISFYGNLKNLGWQMVGSKIFLVESFDFNMTGESAFSDAGFEPMDKMGKRARDFQEKYGK